jgi:hypothetical protein
MKKLLLSTAFLLYASQAAFADLMFQPGSQTVAPGASVSVDVTISGIVAPWLGAYDILVQYDPSILQAHTLIWSSALSGMGSALPDETFPSSDSVKFVVVSLEDAAILGTLQDGNQPLTLGTIGFDAIGPGTSPLHFGSVILGDGNGDPIALASQDGSITVSGVPEPSAYVLLLVPAAIATIRLRARRR